MDASVGATQAGHGRRPVRWVTKTGLRQGGGKVSMAPAVSGIKSVLAWVWPTRSPMALAPASTASFASSTRLMPQILTLNLRGSCRGRGRKSSCGCARAEPTQPSTATGALLPSLPGHLDNIWIQPQSAPRSKVRVPHSLSGGSSEVLFKRASLWFTASNLIIVNTKW